MEPEPWCGGYRGLFEDHKLIYCAILTLRLYQLGQLSEEYKPAFYSFLLNGPRANFNENPLSDWLPDFSSDGLEDATQILGDLKRSCLAAALPAFEQTVTVTEDNGFVLCGLRDALPDPDADLAFDFKPSASGNYSVESLPFESVHQTKAWGWNMHCCLRIIRVSMEDALQAVNNLKSQLF